MYRILTDTSANLNGSLLEQNGVAEIPFSFYVNEEEHRCLDVEGFDSRAFYDAMRQGAKVQTSQVPPLLYEQTMRPILEKGQDVLFIGMSSGISGSFQSAWTASRQLQSEFPERKIRLVDTLGASLGEGLLVLQAARWQQEGVTLEESAARLEALRGRMCQVFTVEDLRYLRATGRLSNAKAAIGTILNIKPLLKGDSQGKIVSFARIHGRKGSIRALAEQYDAYVREAESQTVGIAHADCPEEAACLARLLQRSHPPRDILTVVYEPVTGSHVGPGTLALFFLGDPAFRAAGR